MDRMKNIMLVELIVIIFFLIPNSFYKWLGVLHGFSHLEYFHVCPFLAQKYS